MKYRYAEMIWNEVRDAARDDRVAVLPVATYEDHGPHLPWIPMSFYALASANGP